MEVNEINSWLAATKSVFELFEKIKNLIPDSKEKENLEIKLADAQKAQELAEAELAKALGYKLCQCKFPPPIMLSIGYKPIDYDMREVFKCLVCGKHDPYDGPHPEGPKIPTLKRW